MKDAEMTPSIVEGKCSEETTEAMPILTRRLLEAQRQELEAQKAAFAAEKLESAVRKELHSRKLPEQMASLLTASDEQGSLERVELFQSVFQDALTSALREKMRGLDTPREPTRQVRYTRDSLKGMSHREINAHWDEIVQHLSR